MNVEECAKLAFSPCGSRWAVASTLLVPTVGRAKCRSGANFTESKVLVPWISFRTQTGITNFPIHDDFQIVGASVNKRGRHPYITSKSVSLIGQLNWV